MTIKEKIKSIAEKHAPTLKALGVKFSTEEEQVPNSVVGKLADGSDVYSNSDALAEGASVFIRDAEGNEVPAPNGEHTLEDGRVITVMDGIVTAITTPQEDMSADEVTQMLETVTSKLDEVTKERDELRTQLEAVKQSKTEADTEIQKLTVQVAQLKAKPAARSVKEEQAAASGTKKDDEVKLGSREYFKAIIEGNKN